jgi:hypothetical protein
MSNIAKKFIKLAELEDPSLGSLDEIIKLLDNNDINTAIEMIHRIRYEVITSGSKVCLKHALSAIYLIQYDFTTVGNAYLDVPIYSAIGESIQKSTKMVNKISPSRQAEYFATLSLLQEKQHLFSVSVPTYDVCLNNYHNANDSLQLATASLHEANKALTAAHERFAEAKNRLATLINECRTMQRDQQLHKSRHYISSVEKVVAQQAVVESAVTAVKTTARAVKTAKSVFEEENKLNTLRFSEWFNYFNIIMSHDDSWYDVTEADQLNPPVCVPNMHTQEKR